MKKTSAVVAVCFLILGYEVALFVSKASVTKIAANVDEPDTVYVVDKSKIEALLKRTPQEEINSLALQDTKVTIKKKAQHSTVAKQVVKEHRKIESFKFNPNTVSLEDLQRLGFSEKQAQSIANYRESGEAEYISEYTGSLMIPNTPSNGVRIVFMADSEWKGTYTYTF